MVSNRDFLSEISSGLATGVLDWASAACLRAWNVSCSSPVGGIHDEGKDARRQTSSDSVKHFGTARPKEDKTAHAARFWRDTRVLHVTARGVRQIAEAAHSNSRISRIACPPGAPSLPLISRKVGISAGNSQIRLTPMPRKSA